MAGILVIGAIDTGALLPRGVTVTGELEARGGVGLAKGGTCGFCVTGV